MRVLINGDKWQVMLLDEDEYIRQIDDHTAGTTEITTKQIFINSAYFTKSTIIHELCHAYYSNIPHEQLELDADKTEEAMCEMFGNKGARIVRQANLIFKTLKDTE